MEIEEFAAAHRLRTRLDECGEKIIPGKQGQVYEYSTQELGVMFMPGKWIPKRWGNFKRLGVPLGMTVRQNGDSEGCMSFDPANREQVRLALRFARINRRRQLSEEARAKAIANLAKIQARGAGEAPEDPRREVGAADVKRDTD